MPDYAAFISYSHASDRPTVEAFQQVVQTLGKRWWARRAITVFRDDTHLSATPELWPTILAALEQSRALVLLATPKAAESQWVQQEVDWWLDNHGPDRIYLVLLDGTLEWDRAAGRFTEASDACPTSLRAAFAHEPKYIDLRPYRGRSRRDLARDPEFQSRSGDIAAALHGKPKADLMGEEIRQQRQLVRVFAALGVALLGLLGVAGWQYVEAEMQRSLAVQNEGQARQELVRANRLASELEYTLRGAADVLNSIAITAGSFDGSRKSAEEASREIISLARSALSDFSKTYPDDVRLQVHYALQVGREITEIGSVDSSVIIAAEETFFRLDSLFKDDTADHFFFSAWSNLGILVATQHASFPDHLDRAIAVLQTVTQRLKSVVQVRDGYSNVPLQILRHVPDGFCAYAAISASSIDPVEAYLGGGGQTRKIALDSATQCFEASEAVWLSVSQLSRPALDEFHYKYLSLQYQVLSVQVRLGKAGAAQLERLSGQLIAAQDEISVDWQPKIVSLMRGVDELNFLLSSGRNLGELK